MMRYVFKCEDTDEILENFSVSKPFTDVLEVLGTDYPMIYETFAFHQENPACDALSVETPTICPKTNSANKADIAATIDKLKEFFENGGVKEFFEKCYQEIKRERLKRLTCGELARGINSLLDILSKEKKYARRYRLSGVEDNMPFTCSCWNGLWVNGKRVCLKGGTGKCTMSVYDEANKGILEVCDITSVKSLDSDEGTVKILSYKIQLKELQHLASLLVNLKEHKLDAVILFYMVCE